jgi:hypothetical protein
MHRQTIHAFADEIAQVIEIKRPPFHPDRKMRVIAEMRRRA